MRESSPPTAPTGRAPTAATRSVSIRRPLAAAALATVLVALAAAAAPAQPRPVNAAARVYLAPLGPFPSTLLGDLVAYYRSRLALEVHTAPPFGLEPSTMDPQRQQLVAEEVIALLRRTRPELAPHVIIGLTTYDLYIRGNPDWEWAFSYRERTTAVVSVARMDPANWGEPADVERLRTRLRKMVSKNLGIMYYGLSPGSDRRSVLFGPILGLDDLDAIGEEF